VEPFPGFVGAAAAAGVTSGFGGPSLSPAGTSSGRVSPTVTVTCPIQNIIRWIKLRSTDVSVQVGIVLMHPCHGECPHTIVFARWNTPVLRFLGDKVDEL
jgi:hypothetical protein